MPDEQYKLKLDISDILSGLVKVDKATLDTAKRIEASFKKAGKSIDGLFIDINGRVREANGRFSQMGNEAANGFKSVGGSASASGLQVGAMAGIVSALTTEFINLGQQAIGTLADIGKQSVQTALEIDTLKARLGGIFRGSEEAADQAFTFIQQKSKELGIDLGELAGAFIPKTESLAQFERVAKIATALARSDPEQGAIGARIALIEALSGTFTSLQRRFEIPKSDIDNLKAAFDTGGMEAFLTKFEEVLAASGKSFDDLSDTAQASFSRLAIAGEQLGGRLGTPILEALEAAAQKLNEFVSTNEEDLIVFADTIGRAIAEAINYLASIDLDQIDTSALIEVADTIFRIVKAAEIAVGQFTGFVGAVYQVTDAVSPLGEVLDYLAYIFANIDAALITGAQILAIAKAGYIGLYAGIQPVVEILEKLYEAASKALSGDFAGASQSLSDAVNMSTQDLFDNAAAVAARDASMLESVEQIQDYQESIDGNTESQRKLREELEASANAGTEVADAIQAAGAAERQAAEDAEKLAEAQAKVNEAEIKAATDLGRQLEDIEIETARKRLDIILEFAQKREDAARNNLQKLADIERKNQQEITDAATDLTRDEEDIAIRFAREQIDLERESRQQRLDIETNFRQKLEDIQSRFLFDAEEAERNRDAVALLRLVRQQSKEVANAQVDREREIEQARLTQEQKQAELRIQQARELEDAHLANERKLADLQTNLTRQIEAQNLAYAQQLEDLTIQEARKNEELTTSQQRQIDDANLAYERKLEDLKTSLAAEYEAIKENNALIEEEQARHNEAMAAGNVTPSTTGGSAAGFGETPDTIGSGPSSGGTSGGDRRIGGGGRQFGGPVRPGRSYIVGEAGPEIFRPNQGGTIIPNLRFKESASGGSGGIINNSQNINMAIPPDKLTPGQRSEIRQIALEMLAGVL